MCSSIVFIHLFYFVLVQFLRHFIQIQCAHCLTLWWSFLSSRARAREAFCCKSKCVYAIIQWRRWAFFVHMYRIHRYLPVLHSFVPRLFFHFIPFCFSLIYQFLCCCCFFFTSSSSQTDTHIMFTWFYSVILNGLKMHTRIIASLCFVWFMPPVHISDAICEKSFYYTLR